MHVNSQQSNPLGMEYRMDAGSPPVPINFPASSKLYSKILKSMVFLEQNEERPAVGAGLSSLGSYRE
jgi:hypothetical protein